MKKKKPELIVTSRISPLDDVKYIQVILSWCKALDQLEYIKENDIESEWDDIVSNIYSSFYSSLQSGIEQYSSLLTLKEKGLDINSIDLKDFEEKIKEINLTFSPKFNRDSVFFNYKKLILSRVALVHHILIYSSVPKRDKEIIILRSARLCGSEYIWDHHIDLAKEELISNEEINYIRNRRNEREADSFFSVLISSVDELYTDTMLSEKNWNSLSQKYNVFQLMDFVFIIGSYMQLATVFNALKIQTEYFVNEYKKNNKLPSLKVESDKARHERNLSNFEPFRLTKSRIVPLNEVEYIKELLLFQNALSRLKYTKNENNETEWEKEIDSLIKWLKSYNLTEINGLSSFLKLEEKGLGINSISLQDYEESIKEFINQTGTIFNLKAIMMRYRKLRLYWIIQASHTTYDSSLPLRDKEILILRTAWLCRAQYEWDHHVIAGRRSGLTDAEINNIKLGFNSQKWQAFDKVLIQSVDELYLDNNISDPTWVVLSEQYNMFQLMDLIFTVTSYNLLAMFLNTFGIQTEECVKDLIKKEKK